MQRLKYIISKIPPSNNKYIGQNKRWEYAEAKKEWAQIVRYICRPAPPEPIKKAVVEIMYYFPDKRRRDPDNYSGKFLLDGLVRAEIIADDSFECITLQLGAGYDKENPRTEIAITEIENV